MIASFGEDGLQLKSHADKNVWSLLYLFIPYYNVWELKYNAKLKCWNWTSIPACSWSSGKALDCLSYCNICRGFYLVVLDFELRALCLQSRYLCQSHFGSGYFGDRVSWTSCPGWPWTVILPISASPVTRTTSVSHWHPAICVFFNRYIFF
jgi:hypothetical protein